MLSERIGAELLFEIHFARGEGNELKTTHLPRAEGELLQLWPVEVRERDETMRERGVGVPAPPEVHAMIECERASGTVKVGDRVQQLHVQVIAGRCEEM